MEHLSNDHKDRPILDGKSMEIETATWSGFLNGGKAISEQILASEEISKSKRAEMWGSQSRMWVGKLIIQVRFKVALASESL